MRLVIFDLDGTLIDSVVLIVETITAAFDEIAEPPPTETAIRALSGIGAREAIGIMAPGLAADRQEAILKSYRRHYTERAGVVREALFSGAVATLDRLQAEPGTILAVATGKGYEGAVTLLRRHAIIDRFNSIETPDHNRGKPDPQMIETAMEKAGVERSRTLMIGDTVHDMRMAKAAGVRAIGVAWGYHEVTELVAAGADIVVESFAELESAIDELAGVEDA
jgi:phosphoglycolate phosphatase